MKFTVLKSAIVEALGIIGSVVVQRSVRPILNNVHIVVGDDGRATLVSTDLMEISLRYRLPLVEVAATGEALLPIARTLSIAREAPSEQITFEQDEPGKITIRSGRSVFNVLSDNPADYPQVPEFRTAGSFTLDRTKLLRLIRKTQFAIAKEKSRFAFNGAVLHLTNGEARMVATDGKRLAIMKETVDHGESLATRPIIPLRALHAFDKLLALDEESAQIAVDEREIMLRTPRADVIAPLLEGSFPDYQAVIPKETPTLVRFNRLELASAFRQAALLTSQDSRSVRMSLADGKATLRSQAPDAGAATIDIDAPDYVGEPISIAFNPDYFDEGLRVMESETVTLGLAKANQPAVLMGDENFLYVVMPITLRNA